MPLYDAASVITYAILASISLKPRLYYREIERHASSILFVDCGPGKDVPNSGGLVSMLFQLKAIILATSSGKQISDAQATIRR